jgi:hypothetical protein
MDGSRARAVLGVAEHATTADLQRAFRAAAHAAHPDHGGDTERFAEVVAALAVLRAITPSSAGADPMTVEAAERTAVFVVPAIAARHGIDCYDSPAPPRAPAGDAAQPVMAFAAVLQRAMASAAPSTLR